MQNTLSSMAKKAVDAALQANWDEAISINQQIIDKNPNDLDARVRLGRALIQTHQFDKAKKVFKDVLKEDPINLVARKNLEVISKGRLEHKTPVMIDTKSLLKEPGTTIELPVVIEVKGMTANDFVPSENLSLKIKKKTVEIYKRRKDEDIFVGTIDNPEVVQKLNIAVERNANINSSFIKGKDKSIDITIKSSEPVFKSERQDIRPYIKKGSIDEPELEIEEVEELPEE